jgi:hypothetical protein
MIRVLAVLLLLASSGFAQSVYKRTGETVFLTIWVSDPADSINLYMHTRGYLASQQLVRSIPVVAGQWKYQTTWIMPAGMEPEYRFFAVPQKGSEFAEESNGVRVKRKK